MAAEQANITENIVQMAAEAAWAVVQVMTITSAENNQRAPKCGTQTRQTHHETTNI